MCEATSVSTKSLTDKIVEESRKKDFFSDSGKSLVDLIQEKAKNIYSATTDGSLNFEEIFHVLELMPNYLRMEGGKSFVSPYNIFTNIKEEFSEFKNEIVTDNARLIINIINDGIYSYDQKFQEKGREYQYFFKELAGKTNCSLDVFNLNYDTWMEQTLTSYNDGFIDIPGYCNKMQRFEISEYYTKDERHTISHLHGQILFEYPEFTHNDNFKYAFYDPKNTLYKYSTYEQARDFRTRSIRSNESTQAGENIFRSNLITGLMKTEKLLWNPMAAYHNKLMNSLLSNTRLLIIGYGFGDLYINALLEQYIAMHYADKKVAVVDYVDRSEKALLEYIPGNSFFSPSAKSIFMKRIFGNDYWCHNRPEKDIYYSEKQDACVCICGFKDAIEYHMDDILEIVGEK